MSNYWADRWRQFKTYHPDDELEDEALEREAIEAENMETYPCEEEGCNGTAHYRPGVGGWWCTTCGELIVK